MLRKAAEKLLSATLQNVLAQRPFGLVLDIDGTLSPLAPTPDAARLYPGVQTLLEEIRGYPDTHIAIVTGRALEDGAAMVNVDGLVYVGTHGLEWSEGLPTSGFTEIKIEPGALKYIEPGKQLLDFAETQLSHIPGLLVERKRIGGAVHYRLCANPSEVREEILATLTPLAQKLNMRLNDSKFSIEIIVPLAVNKGKALRRLTRHWGLHGVIFAGDDRTDLDGMKEIVCLKQEGLAALSVAVKHHDTLPPSLETADIVVDEVEGMVGLLQEIRKNL